MVWLTASIMTFLVVSELIRGEAMKVTVAPVSIPFAKTEEIVCHLEVTMEILSV